MSKTVGRTLLLLFVFFVPLQNYAQGSKTFLDYSLVHTKFGERIAGSVVQDNPIGLKIVRANQDSLLVQHRNIKKIWTTQEDILVRSDGKYAFLDHVSFGITQTFLGYAQQFRFQFGIQFARDWYTGISFGDHFEFSDFQGFFITNFYLRKYFTFSDAQRLFAGVSYGISRGSEFNAFGDGFSGIHTGNAELGIIFLNRKATKFELAGGMHVRNRDSRQTVRDINGNVVVLDTNTTAIAAFLRIGVIFRLFGY
ncbi:MAG TPA: hypothetical protein VJ917_01140 [Saprospiraceae bacterium]|nr:hypothetical protein [Saprospiraceae bacterium]